MEITTIEFFRVNYFYKFIFEGRIKIIDLGDNNDRILSSKLFLFLFVFGRGIKIIDRETIEFFRVNNFSLFIHY